MCNLDMCNLDMCNLDMYNLDMHNLDMYNLDMYNLDIINVVQMSPQCLLLLQCYSIISRWCLLLLQLIYCCILARVVLVLGVCTLVRWGSSGGTVLNGVVILMGSVVF